MDLDGARAEIDCVVTEEMTAIALGSGDVPVLGTPKVVALVEQAAVAAIADRLVDGSTTVGSRIDLDHVAPTKVGATVSARASVVDVDRRKVTFDVEVTEGEGVVARGSHVRFVVDRDRFES